MPKSCAPGKYDAENNTCFTIDQLVEMAGAYNRYVTRIHLNPTNTANVNINLITILTPPNKKYLLQELRWVIAREAFFAFDQVQCLQVK